MSKEDLKEYLKTHPQKGFESVPFHSQDGDFVSLFFEDKGHWAYQIDPYLTAYAPNEFEGEVVHVGFKLCGIDQLIGSLVRYGVCPEGATEVSLPLLLCVAAIRGYPDAAAKYARFGRRSAGRVVTLVRPEVASAQ